MRLADCARTENCRCTAMRPACRPSAADSAGSPTAGSARSGGYAPRCRRRISVGEQIDVSAVPAVADDRARSRRVRARGRAHSQVERPQALADARSAGPIGDARRTSSSASWMSRCRICARDPRQARAEDERFDVARPRGAGMHELQQQTRVAVHRSRDVAQQHEIALLRLRVRVGSDSTSPPRRRLLRSARRQSNAPPPLPASSGASAWRPAPTPGGSCSSRARATSPSLSWRILSGTGLRRSCR